MNTIPLLCCCCGGGGGSSSGSYSDGGDSDGGDCEVVGVYLCPYAHTGVRACLCVCDSEDQIQDLFHAKQKL